jgi:hypothetical protein
VAQPPNGWSSTEQHLAGGAVRFEQRARPPAPAVDLSEGGARELAERYWREVEAFTGRLVQPWQRGDRLELRLLNLWTLLSFGRPETHVDGSQASSRFPILGGALVRAPGGSITFSQTVAPELELRTTVDGFLPRLGARSGGAGWTALPWEVQRRLHVAVSRRYLALLVDRASR